MINKLVIIILLLGCFVTGVYAGEVTVSSGTSVDLTAHRRPYTTVLKMGQQDFNVAGSAIVSGWALTGRDKPPFAAEVSYALVFYHDGTWSTGATNRVDSIGGGKYFLPKGKNPKDILGVGSSGIGGFNRRGFVFVWFNDGTACRGRFPYHKELYTYGQDVSEDKIYKYYLKRYGIITIVNVIYNIPLCNKLPVWRSTQYLMVCMRVTTVETKVEIIPVCCNEIIKCRATANRFIAKFRTWQGTKLY